MSVYNNIHEVDYKLRVVTSRKKYTKHGIHFELTGDLNLRNYS